MIEIIRATFLAGEVKTFLIQGEYLEILEAAYPVDVAMMDRSGAQLSTMRNAEASYFSRPGRYEVIQVTSAAAQTVRLFVGSGDAGTRRTSGDVSVIDGGKSRTAANRAFIASGYTTGTAGNLPIVQLWNPPGSVRNFVVKKIGWYSSTTGGITWAFQTASLLTPGGIPTGKSKMLGGANSAGLVQLGNLAALPGVPMGGPTALVTFATYSFDEPLIIPPGFGFSISHNSAATDIFGHFEYFEDSL